MLATFTSPTCSVIRHFIRQGSILPNHGCAGSTTARFGITGRCVVRGNFHHGIDGAFRRNMLIPREFIILPTHIEPMYSAEKRQPRANASSSPVHIEPMHCRKMLVPRKYIILPVHIAPMHSAEKRQPHANASSFPWPWRKFILVFQNAARRVRTERDSV